jgi:hypothetical protein
MPSTQDNLEKLRSSKPSPRVITEEDARNATSTSQLGGSTRVAADPAMETPVQNVGYNGLAESRYNPISQEEASAKIVLFNAAWPLYLTMRPKIAFPDLPKAPNTNSPLEAKTDYAKALSAQLQTAQEYASNESKALWKKLFNEDI